jgi:hypothetical protein
MIVVIQCAGSKRSGAGCLVSSGGKRVLFVADPEAAPANDVLTYAKPDDPADNGMSWRGVLLKCNEDKRDNSLGLFPAWQLYENRTYGRLVDRCGVKSVYILPAGWGLISAGFLTPYYDITFSPSARNADAYKRRRRGDGYQDLCMLPPQTREHILFFEGKDYLPLFCTLTSSVKSRKTVFYNSARLPQAAGCELKPIFDTLGPAAFVVVLGVGVAFVLMIVDRCIQGHVFCSFLALVLR